MFSQVLLHFVLCVPVFLCYESHLQKETKIRHKIKIFDVNCHNLIIFHLCTCNIEEKNEQALHKVVEKVSALIRNPNYANKHKRYRYCHAIACTNTREYPTCTIFD